MDKDTRKKGSLSCLSEQNLCQEIHFIFVGTLFPKPAWAVSVCSVPAPVQFFWGVLALWCCQSPPGREGCPRVAQGGLEVPWLLQPVLRPPPMLGLSLLSAQLIHLWNGKVHRASSGPSLPTEVFGDVSRQHSQEGKVKRLLVFWHTSLQRVRSAKSTVLEMKRELVG